MLIPVTHIRGQAVHIPGDDIDTDRITPARYLKVVTFDTLGEALFYDERFGQDGPKAHPLNDPRFAQASILLVGANFGCGSSREHSPQAIYRAGFKALIGESFAEIFFGNSTTLGIPCFTATKEDITHLADSIQLNPGLQIQLDIATLTASYAGTTFSLSLPGAAQKALLEGRWDPIADLLEAGSLLEEASRRLPLAG
jgi:3-isopropylmalate/(R)-2-methylmalate dehydratase small subunit